MTTSQDRAPVVEAWRRYTQIIYNRFLANDPTDPSSMNLALLFPFLASWTFVDLFPTIVARLLPPPRRTAVADQPLELWA